MLFFFIIIIYLPASWEWVVVLADASVLQPGEDEVILVDPAVGVRPVLAEKPFAEESATVGTAEHVNDLHLGIVLTAALHKSIQKTDI